MKRKNDIPTRITEKAAAIFHEWNLRIIQKINSPAATRGISIHIIVPNLPWRSKTKNFLSIFCRPPPTPPAEEKKKGKENFWFLLPRPKGADEAHPFASPRNRSVRFRFKPPRARSARHHLFWK